MVGEFFTSADEVWYRDEEGVHPLREGSPVVAFITERVQELYPEAFAALQKIYARSARNVPYYRFLIARRFCKCNFGSLDYTKSDVNGAGFNVEFVSCPLRGECPNEGIVCQPKMCTRLSKAEQRVMRLVCDGCGNQEIADILFLSPNTVKRHISTAFIKTGAKNRADFVKKAKDNSFFI